MRQNISGIAAKVLFSLFAVAFFSGMTFAETAVRDLEDVRLSIEKSAMPVERKAPLFRKVSNAVSSGIPSPDAAVIVKRGIARGFEARTLEETVDIVIGAREKGLPVRPLLDRLQQGLSKGVPPEKLTAATRRLSEKLGAGDTLISGLSGRGIKVASEGERAAAVYTVARSLEHSIPEEAITSLGLKAVKQGAPLSSFDTALNSMTAFVEMGMPVEQASGLIGKAIDRGYSEKEMVVMEREVSAGLREGRRMEEIMKDMEKMINNGRPREWRGGMEGGSMQKQGSASGMDSGHSHRKGPGPRPK
jgi:hypothetical protein